jgi:hypothetical protein
VDQDSSTDGRHRALSVLKMLRPHKVAGFSKIRVGRMFDGGYVMLDDFKDISAAYSLGINDDVSWDLEIARRGIPIFQYDHTIESLPEPHPLFHWEKKRIDGVADDNTQTIEDIVAANGHKSATDLLLKCDIEGAEWHALRNLPATILTKFRQIVLEMHDFQFLFNDRDAENVRATIANLVANHVVVHVHANNHCPWIVVGGIALPSVLELTLVRRDIGEFSISDEVFPTPIDMPNLRGAADFYLGRFEFA